MSACRLRDLASDLHVHYDAAQCTSLPAIADGPSVPVTDPRFPGCIAVASSLCCNCFACKVPGPKLVVPWTLALWWLELNDDVLLCFPATTHRCSVPAQVSAPQRGSDRPGTLLPHAVFSAYPCHTSQLRARLDHRVCADFVPDIVLVSSPFIGACPLNALHCVQLFTCAPSVLVAASTQQISGLWWCVLQATALVAMSHRTSAL